MKPIEVQQDITERIDETGTQDTSNVEKNVNNDNENVDHDRDEDNYDNDNMTTSMKPGEIGSLIPPPSSSTKRGVASSSKQLDTVKMDKTSIRSPPKSAQKNVVYDKSVKDTKKNASLPCNNAEFTESQTAIVASLGAIRAIDDELSPLKEGTKGTETGITETIASKKDRNDANKGDIVKHFFDDGVEKNIDAATKERTDGKEENDTDYGAGDGDIEYGIGDVEEAEIDTSIVEQTKALVAVVSSSKR